MSLPPALPHAPLPPLSSSAVTQTPTRTLRPSRICGVQPLRSAEHRPRRIPSRSPLRAFAPKPYEGSNTMSTRRTPITVRIFAAGAALAALALGAGCSSDGADGTSRVRLLNVSYDPTRELYQEVNASFAALWREQTGQE